MTNLPAIACEGAIRETDTSIVGGHKIQGRFWFPWMWRRGMGIEVHGIETIKQHWAEERCFVIMGVPAKEERTDSRTTWPQKNEGDWKKLASISPFTKNPMTKNENSNRHRQMWQTIYESERISSNSLTLYGARALRRRPFIGSMGVESTPKIPKKTTRRAVPRWSLGSESRRACLCVVVQS